MKRYLRFGAAGLFVAAVAGCSDSTLIQPNQPDSGLPLKSSSTTISTTEECQTIDFESFAHGDPIDVVELTFVAGTFKASVVQFNYGTAGDKPTAYDTGLTPPFPNATHNDTQWKDPGFCSECAPAELDVGIMMVVEDENFAANGDNTEGGQLIFTITEGGDLGDYRIASWLSVDDDEGEEGRRLFVDGNFVGKAPGDGPNGDVEVVTPSANTWISEALFEFGRQNGELEWTDPDVNGSGGVDQIEVCLTPTGGGEGCTPGFWKNNTGAWPLAYATTDLFCDVFTCLGDIDLRNPHRGELLNDQTLLDALKLRGGGVNALARHAAAALLNAESSVSFDMSVSAVISAVNDALDGGDIEGTKNTLAELNEKGCPLAADEASDG